MAESDINIPQKTELLIPILKVLSDGNIWKVSDLVNQILIDMGLPESALEIKTTNKNKPELQSQVEWACSELVKRGLIEYPATKKRKTGNRRILPLGLEVLENKADPDAIMSMKAVDDSSDWIPASYSPNLSTADWIELINDPTVFNKKSLELMSKILPYENGITCTQLSKRFGGNPQTYNSTAVQLAKRIYEKTNCPLYIDTDGSKRYWPILFTGKNAAKDEDGKYLWNLRPELKLALSETGLASHEDERTGTTSFFDYLSKRGLEFDTEVVEDFLLSLKAKQFVILSGGTGTGKTKLAQAYGEYISTESQPIEMKTEVTLGKSVESNGFTLNREDFFKAFPNASNADGEYKFRIGDCTGMGEIKMTPRFWFVRDENREAILDYLNKMRTEKDKAELVLIAPESVGNKNYEIVPVGPNWTDGRHILGYRNAISGQYSSTPALDLLMTSNEDRTRPYMLILDEMNLSHVERYLSDIISCMESGEAIHLDSDGMIPERLSLGDNLFVVGTVNMDETTYTFSPKVLDRANVLEIGSASVKDYLSNSGPLYSPTGDVEYIQDCRAGIECRGMNARDILTVMKADISPDIISSMVDDLDRMQTLMSEMGLPFAYRTLDEVMRFMYVSWIYEGKTEFSNWKRYMDSQIHQKILPKIHGNSSILEKLKALRDFCGENGYPKSKEKLVRMTSVLESQRYVSFNS